MSLKSMFKFLSFFALILMGVCPSVRAEVTCPPKPQGDIHINWGSDAIQYDFNKSQSQMDRMENDTENPYGTNVKTHVGGLMNGGIAIQSQVQVATLNYPRTKQICQWIDRMDVNITIKPKILIAREHRKGSCQHEAILEHEMKHVFVDREIVKKYIDIMKRDLEQAIRKVGIVGPKDERDQRKFQEKISRYMEDRLKDLSDKLYAERRKEQQNIDTLKEYDRVAGVCD